MQPILFTNNDKHIERLRIAIHGHAKTIAWITCSYLVRESQLLIFLKLMFQQRGHRGMNV